MNGHLTRRSLMGSAAAAALVPGALTAASLNATRDRTTFTALLYTLAGPVTAAPALLDSVTALFSETFGAGAIDALVAHVDKTGLASVLEPAKDAETETWLQWLTEALFTGSANPADSTARMVNYPYALGWKSLAFAKAPGLCDGPGFGYWSSDWGAL